MVALALSPVRFSVDPRCLYQAQDSTQTLAQGLAEYYAQNAGRVLPPEALTPESAELFRSHDICHVIFGLDTTLADEVMADTRSLLSCDVGWKRYSKYVTGNADAQAIFKQIGYGAAFWGTIRTTPRIVRAIREAFRMPKRWPWVPPDAYQSRMLADLRREYGIRVI
jgi:hypothetical protein